MAGLLYVDATNAIDYMPELPHRPPIFPRLGGSNAEGSSSDDEDGINSTMGTRSQRPCPGAVGHPPTYGQANGSSRYGTELWDQVKYLVGRAYTPALVRLGNIKEALFSGDAYAERGVIAQEVAVLVSFLVIGWSDASTGSVLPSIEAHYNVNFVVVSMLFICNLVGCYLAAFAVPFVLDRHGLGLTYAAFAAIAIAPFAVFIPLPPYALFCIMFTFTGLSNAASDSLGNTFMTTRPRSAVRLGVLHFVYGLGAFLAPLAAVPFNSGKAGRFSNFYAIPLGLAALNTALLGWSLGLKKAGTTTSASHSLSAEEHELVQGTNQRGHSLAVPAAVVSRPSRTEDDVAGAKVDITSTTSSIHATTPTADVARECRTSPAQRQVIEEGAAQRPRHFQGTMGKLRAVMSQRNVHILAAFTLIYVGTEVSIGGWTSTFLLRARGDEVDKETANYLVSGFWAGIAGGRVLLIPLTSALGDELAVMVYLAAAVGLQLMLWLVPNVITSALALALMGIVLGPIFPILIEVASRKIRPRALHATAISWLVSCGAAGSALLPFIVGLSAQSRGIDILAPLLVGLLVAQLLVWIVLVGRPSKARSRAEAERLD